MGYEFEGQGYEALKDARRFMNIEHQAVVYKHSLVDNILGIHHVIGHLMELVPDEDEDLQMLIAEVAGVIHELSEILTGGKFDVRIEREERKIIRNLKEDLDHGEWRVVQRKLGRLGRLFGKIIQLQEHELKEIHGKFMEIMKLIKRSEAVDALHYSAEVYKDPSAYATRAEYYFAELFKLARAYERFFRDILRKERKLNKVVRWDRRKIVL